TIRTTHKEPYIEFSNNTYINFLIYNHIKKSIWSKTGFAVFPDAFENYWKFFTVESLKYQLHSLSYQKQGQLFKIEALLLLQNVVTDTEKKNKKNTHHCKINTFIISFRISNLYELCQNHENLQDQINELIILATMFLHYLT
ncbi:hypothetical protein FWK35_00023533, partial [Aphis craccivora]